jgi:hypothetical protein
LTRRAELEASTQRRTGVYGYHKQGAKFDHTKIAGKSVLVKWPNILAGVVSAPLSRPVITAPRLQLPRIPRL